jgi:putative PIN family toxin of toxin-antitoxin system
VRILLDTNVLVSACLSRASPPGQLFDLWRHLAFELVMSDHQLDELVRALSYPRIRARLDAKLAENLLKYLEAVPLIAVAGLPALNASPDADDNLILAAAAAGSADLLATGDKADLLSLGTVQGVEIVTTRQALARLTAQENKP